MGSNKDKVKTNVAGVKRSTTPALPVVRAAMSDVEPWLKLARQVEHLFGPMVGHGFDRAVLANISRDSAFCVRDSHNPGILAGAILFDYRDAPNYEISWLAVDSDHRKRGIGRNLVYYALARTVTPSVIKVVTFGPDHPGRADARNFYESFGFLPGAQREPGPEGGSRQEFFLERKCA